MRPAGATNTLAIYQYGLRSSCGPLIVENVGDQLFELSIIYPDLTLTAAFTTLGEMWGFQVQIFFMVYSCLMAEKTRLSCYARLSRV